MTEARLPKPPEPDLHDNGDVFGNDLTYGYTADQMHAYGLQCAREQRERDAAKCRGEMIGTNKDDDPVDRAHDRACKDCERAILAQPYAPGGKE